MRSETVCVGFQRLEGFGRKAVVNDGFVDISIHTFIDMGYCGSGVIRFV